MIKRLERRGDVDVRDTGKRRTYREIALRIDAPGHGVPTEAVFEYREIYGQIARSWELLRYTYEYRPKPRPSRRAYHLHPPIGEHQHCVPPTGAGQRHFRAYRMSLIDAHDEFARLYASGRPIDCDGLHPLRPALR